MKTVTERIYPEHGDRFYLGLDLGQREDYTALAVVRRLAPPDWDPGQDHHDCPLNGRYLVQGLKRYRLGTGYPDVVRHVSALCGRVRDVGTLPRPACEVLRHRGSSSDCVRWVGNERRPEVRLVVDATGVGLPVVDMFCSIEMPGVSLLGASITGGSGAREVETRRGQGASYSHWHVAKRELVGVMQSLLQTRRIKVASSLAEAATLLHELQNFTVRLSDSANEIYSTARDGDHDDTVLAVALACWAGERVATAQARFL
jgi:hypothetical protein